MTYILQIMIGIGIGIISAIVLTPLAIGYVNSHRNENLNSNSNKSSSDFWSKPGERCPICLCEMESRRMQYLSCGHALHEECFKEYRKFYKQCPTCRTDF